ncbi:MAG: RpiR family transcriptional regulator [Rhodobacteraceae bacterium]|nr:RpiR family transcriptional regulator [Paracoccaceae bacterium]MAY44905.1 RpiR family transcriptional regulator [Paracoccaceae bacterium]QEW20784.1 Glv operon regulatory protein [Marinibacterium anthonyi]
MDKRDDIPACLGDLISQHSDRLTDADGRILDVLRRDPVRAAMENGKEVSSRAGVHPASAVRLARRLGFKGYPDFRAFLQASLIEGQGEYENAPARIAARLARAGEDGLFNSILESEISALQALRGQVGDTDIRKFSQILRGAGRIFLMGAGHGAALACLVTLRLRRSGCDAVDLSPMGQQRVEWLHGMTGDDVLWLINFRRASDDLQGLRRLAAARGALCLALTDPRGARFDPPPDAQIAVSRGGAGESQSLVVPMTIANTVILDLAAIDDGRTMRSLAGYRDLRDKSLG